MSELAVACPCGWAWTSPEYRGSAREQRAVTEALAAHAREHVAKGEPIPVPQVVA